MLHLTVGFLTMRVAASAVDALCATLLEAVGKIEPPRSAKH